MNRKVRKLMREVERRGGRVGLSDSIPEDVAAEFLAQILDCPDCRAEANDRFRNREPIDRVLAGAASRGTPRDH